MAKLPCNNKGFTLIEVLVALVILAVALTAVMKTSLQTTHNAQYLEDKTIAHWVGMYVVSEIRLRIIEQPKQGSMQMLGSHWFWLAKTQQTADTHTLRVDIKISKKKDSPALAGLTTYMQAQHHE